ncbi:MAG: hypothetical protein FWD57_09310 [Polyangiaceae bacterium]|nr:hypothetical protein [Polyangiaceae bacterium]
MRRIIATGLLAVVGVLAFESTASAQEIQLTGPLAGAPAVRELRWHRNKRFEIAPAVSFSLLDEYQRTLFVGARLQYHLTDWLGLGVWGAFGVVNFNTGLTDEIDKVNKTRWGTEFDRDHSTRIDRNSSILSVGYDFPSQLGKISWVVAPQVTAVPFRGKLAIFEKIFVDTDVYIFAGPAFVGVEERATYSAAQLADPTKSVYDPTCIDKPQDCRPIKSYPMATRLAIAPTFGGGITFFTGQWGGIGVEYRAIPFSWNNSGFDSKGGPPDGNGPDFIVDEKDRQLRFNQMITLSFSVFLPTQIKISP